jgi:hypothetical protein
MRFVGVAVIGGCVLAAIGAGAARATVGGGDTIATAPVVAPGVLENGSTATFTDSCQNGHEFWMLQLEQGDLVKITWGSPAAVDTLALWAPGTTDANNDGCLYASGWSHWTGSPVLEDSNGVAGNHVAQTVATATGSYPLLFLNTTGANAGAYSFTAVVLHAASVSLPHRSTIRGSGTLKASVSAPDGSAITDDTLTLTLTGYWSSRAGAPASAHKLASATPTNGKVTFSYSLPATEWGKTIRLDISGGGASSSYQTVMSAKLAVKVLVPIGNPVGLVPSSALKEASKLLRQPIYWAGPRKGFHYEFWRLTNGNIYVRYLPHGVKAGVTSAKFLIVATYPYRGAYAALTKYSHGKAVAGPHGSIYFARPTDPKSVYVAFPNVNYEVEIYDPSAAVSRSIAATGRVVPVG